MTAKKLLPQNSFNAVKLSCTIDNNWRSVKFRREARVLWRSIVAKLANIKK